MCLVFVADLRIQVKGRADSCQNRASTAEQCQTDVTLDCLRWCALTFYNADSFNQLRDSAGLRRSYRSYVSFDGDSKNFRWSFGQQLLIGARLPVHVSDEGEHASARWALKRLNVSVFQRRIRTLPKRTTSGRGAPASRLTSTHADAPELFSLLRF